MSLNNSVSAGHLPLNTQDYYVGSGIVVAYMGLSS